MQRYVKPSGQNTFEHENLMSSRLVKKRVEPSGRNTFEQGDPMSSRLAENTFEQGESVLRVYFQTDVATGLPSRFYLNVFGNGSCFDTERV
jgi:hypothetical protein